MIRHQSTHRPLQLGQKGPVCAFTAYVQSPRVIGSWKLVHRFQKAQWTGNEDQTEVSVETPGYWRGQDCGTSAEESQKHEEELAQEKGYVCYCMLRSWRTGAAQCCWSPSPRQQIELQRLLCLPGWLLVFLWSALSLLSSPTCLFGMVIYITSVY